MSKTRVSHLVREVSVGREPLEVNDEDGRQARERELFRRLASCLALGTVPVGRWSAYGLLQGMKEDKPSLILFQDLLANERPDDSLQVDF